jgi:lipopolysaccharide transport system ATP-binding protein
LCDEAVWLSGGRLMAQGAAADVVHQYATHMGVADSPPVEPPPPEEDSYPVASPPPVIVRTTSGEEVAVDEQRFGSVELEIGAVQLLDAESRPVTELLSGQAIQIEIAYVAIARLVAPIFYARVTRDDGLLCYDLDTEFSALSLAAIQGPGYVALHVDRLDLNSGRYVIEVGGYAQGWAYCYDFRSSVCSLTIRGTGRADAAMNVPHRWEIKRRGAEPLVAGAESAGSSSV